MQKISDSRQFRQNLSFAWSKTAETPTVHKQELRGKIHNMPETELPKYLEGWCKIASLGAKHKLLSARSNVQLEHKALTTEDRTLQSAKNTVKEILALRCSTFMQSFK